MLLPADNLISFIRNISKIYVTKVQSFLNVIFVGTQLAVYLDKMFFFHELVSCYYLFIFEFIRHEAHLNK